MIKVIDAIFPDLKAGSCKPTESLKGLGSVELLGSFTPPSRLSPLCPSSALLAVLLEQFPVALPICAGPPHTVTLGLPLLGVHTLVFRDYILFTHWVIRYFKAQSVVFIRFSRA